MGIEGRREIPHHNEVKKGKTSRKELVEFGQAYKKVTSLLDPRTSQEKADLLGINRSTRKRREDGESLPEWAQVQKTIDTVNRLVVPGVPAEMQREVRDRYETASLLRPKEVKNRLEAAMANWRAAERRVKETEHALSQANAHMARLATLVAGGRGASKSVPDDDAFPDDDDSRYTDGLRNRLKHAIKEMDKALNMQRQSIEDLRECGRRLVELASQYLLFRVE